MEAQADSPLTSTVFYTAYEKAASVQHALANGLDEETVYFLGTKNSPVEKIAVINAISWGNEANVSVFEAFLIKNRKGLEIEVFDYLRGDVKLKDKKQLDVLTADDLMCWAYLQAMGDYFKPQIALNAARMATEKEPGSMAHAVVLALVKSQVSFDTSWCRVFLDCKELIVDKSYAKNTLSTEAVEGIMGYISLYEQDCK